MSRDERAELFEQFTRACALSEEARASFLAELARRDPGAARELAELVEQDRRGGPLPSAPSEKRSLLDSIVAALARDGEPGADEASRIVLEKLAARASASSRYAIQGELARGGMGAILEVWDEDLGRKLAMKVSLGATSSRADARRLARFLEEAQVTGQLDHPGI